MSCGEENTECPLCMEPLEMDDINFFPCTCGYQICRFCWHRIRTDENGLCPACRKQYPEDPAEFKPLTEDELQRIKKERRQKDLQRKQKAAENRKHLANVRVVQRNLVFVVGLSQRLADPEVLKKHEYFGKFGKIHKVVINHSTSYAGAQVRTGPSASAYVTYHKPEDALRAIQAVNNIYVDGRTLKASLGTTKYCSHFLRGAQCPKPDCMYLHELGEEAASFTKEEMQQGKHQEYEQKLYEGFMNSQNLSNHQTLPPPSSSSLPTVPSTTTNSTTTATNSSNNTASSKAQRKKTSSPPTIQPSGGTNSSHPPPNTNKEAWPSLSSSGGSNNSGGRPERLTNGNKAPHPPSQSPTSQSSTSSLSSGSSTSSTSSTSSSSSAHKQDVQNAQNRAPGHHRSNNHTNIEPHNSHNHSNSKKVTQGNNSRNAVSPLSAQSPPPHLSLQASPPLHQVSPPPSQVPQVPGVVPPLTQSPIGTSRRSPFDTSDSLSLFSNSGFPTMRNPNKPAVATTTTTEGISAIEIPDTIPVSSTTDWSAAFGFSSSSHNTVEPHDDDLGFDPWDESSKALADLIEKESYPQYPYMSEHSRLSGLMNNGPNNDQYAKNLPPGFAPNHIGAYTNQIPRPGASKMMGLQFAPMANHNSQNTYHDMLSDISLSSMSGDNHTTHHNTQNANVNVQDWQDGLRALLPNINISFGAPTAPITPPNHQHPPQPHPQQQQQQHHHHPQQQQQQQQMRPHSHKDWSNSSNSPSTDLPLDPAIVISGNITHSTSLSDDTPPHWMASLHHLTEDNTNHRLPFVHQFPFRGPTWGGPQAHHPPPGFHQTHLSSPTRVAETHRLAEGLQ